MIRDNSVNILGVNINNISLYEATEIILLRAINKEIGYVVTPNVDHIVRLNNNTKLKNIYNNAFIAVADGMPLVWMSRLIGKPLKERVTGVDLFESICKHSISYKSRLYFIGGELGAAEGSVIKLEERFPGIQVVGAACPPFEFELDSKLNDQFIKEIRSSRPDILFVGLGSPRQEVWLAQNLKATGASVGMGIGVSFSYTAGILARSPAFLQSCGLEWMWRLIHEPKKLWYRYLIRDPLIFWIVLKKYLL